MRLPFILGSAAALGCAAIASADFTGWSVERITLGNGHIIMNVYANFSSTSDRLLNVVKTDVSSGLEGGFYQSGSNPFWKPANSQNSQTSDDSWVTIDTNPNGNGNAFGGCLGDPNFVNFDDQNSSYDFSFIESAGNGAGWYNGNPSGNNYGFADGGKVLVAHFVAANAQIGDTLTWIGRCTVKLANGETATEQGAGTFAFEWIVPGPGALALLGAAGLASRRRRA